MIEIRIYTSEAASEGTVKAQIEAAMGALGFVRQKALSSAEWKLELLSPEQLAKLESTDIAATEAQIAAEAEAPAEQATQTPAGDPNYIGKDPFHNPMPGVSETLAAQDVKTEAPAPAKKLGRPRKTKDEEQPNISTQPENRVDPENVDPPQVQAQDKADEAAEVEASRDPERPLTVDDVRNVVAEYVKKFGIGPTQEDGPKIFREALGAPPMGHDYWKMSILPNDQEKLARTISMWKRAVAENPLKRQAA